MKFLTLALGLLPSVLAGVQAVEVALAGQKGATKKAAVMAVVTAVAKAGSVVPEDHVKVISALIDSVVGTLNASGVFAKSPLVNNPLGSTAAQSQSGSALAGIGA